VTLLSPVASYTCSSQEETCEPDLEAVASHE
jgi:hypothetical protein